MLPGEQRARRTPAGPGHHASSSATRPYSVGQTAQNDDNANLQYPTLDAAIETTYAARSDAGLKRNLYDSYIRAIRWATDRIGDRGVIGFVTNGWFIDSHSADGLRQTLAEEFSAIYCLQPPRQPAHPGEQSRQEGGKVFGSASRTPVAITLLVKKLGNALGPRFATTTSATI